MSFEINGIIKVVFAAPADVKPIIYVTFSILTIPALHIFLMQKYFILVSSNLPKFFFADSNTHCFSTRDLCSLFK